jgi:hypothetical protein
MRSGSRNERLSWRPGAGRQPEDPPASQLNDVGRLYPEAMCGAQTARWKSLRLRRAPDRSTALQRGRPERAVVDRHLDTNLPSSKNKCGPGLGATSAGERTASPAPRGPYPAWWSFMRRFGA